MTRGADARDVSRAHGEGLAAHSKVGLSLADFEEGVRGLLARDEGGAPREWARLRRTAGDADLFLAIACDRSAPGAWARFDETFAPRIEALLRRRGADASEAEATARSLAGDLVQPPASGRARTRLGTWNGSAPLFAWLAVVAVRAWRARLRARLPGPGTEDDDPAAPPDRGAAPLVPVDPALAERVGRALDAAWRTFSPRESVAVVLRHRDGVPQRAIARALGVGESRVSHLLARATRKLRRAVDEGFRGDPSAVAPETAADWEALRRVLSRALSSRTVELPLPRGEPRPGVPPHGR